MSAKKPPRSAQDALASTWASLSRPARMKLAREIRQVAKLKVRYAELRLEWAAKEAAGGRKDLVLAHRRYAAQAFRAARIQAGLADLIERNT